MEFTKRSLFQHYFDKYFDLLIRINFLFQNHGWIRWKELMRLQFEYSDLNWNDFLNDTYLSRLSFFISEIKKLPKSLNNILIYGDELGILSNYFFEFRRENIKICQISKKQDWLTVSDSMNFDQMCDNWRFKSCFRNSSSIDLAQTAFQTIRFSDKRETSFVFDPNLILIEKAEEVPNLILTLNAAPVGKFYTLLYLDNHELKDPTNYNIQGPEEIISQIGFTEVHLNSLVETGFGSLWMIAGKK